MERRGLSWGALPAELQREMDEVIELWKTAAGLGLDQAQTWLAVMYAKGEGVKKDDVEAVKWFRLAAAQNYAVAQYNLGVMYGNGEGVKKDEVEPPSCTAWPLRRTTPRPT